MTGGTPNLGGRPRGGLPELLGAEGYAAYIRDQNADRQRRYRADHKGRRKWKPFVGCDGEGGGTDDKGRQNFLLFRVGDLELFEHNRPLATADCLELILAAPADALLVGFFFTYDCTMILRDLPEERLRRLFLPTEPGRSPYTYWQGYAIEYRPKQYLRVARTRRDQRRMNVEPGSSRTINETGGFFQQSFVKAITDWEIGTKYGRGLIAEQKSRRNVFEQLTDVERRYCRMECDYLAQLMERFREACHDAHTMPASWRGAGAISAALHKNHNTPRRRDLHRSERLETYAKAAYFGGRFEIAQVGRIPGPVWEADIGSAYPAHMRELPCALHSRWRRLRDPLEPREPREYAVADVTFSHPDGTPLCGLPIRTAGRLYWPAAGRGTYWHPELHAAVEAGAEIVRFHGGYYCERCCDCEPYDWIEPLYLARKRLGKATRGYPLKLGLNGLYGKLAQRQGGAPYRDLAAAGLITAMTRAQLIRAYASQPEAVVMMATDSIFSCQPLSLDLGDGLGQWEQKVRSGGLFVVQPGIYWTPGSDELPKTRGIPRSAVIEHAGEFERVWQKWLGSLAGWVRSDRAPSVAVPVRNFIGHRLALARNKPDLAGCWIDAPREIAFDWHNKRQMLGQRIVGPGILTMPHPGHEGLKSEPYDPDRCPVCGKRHCADPAHMSEIAERDLELEADPDFFPWGNTGE